MERLLPHDIDDRAAQLREKEDHGHSLSSFRYYASLAFDRCLMQLRSFR